MPFIRFSGEFAGQCVEAPSKEEIHADPEVCLVTHNLRKMFDFADKVRLLDKE